MIFSVIFYPNHFARTILSIPFCPIPFCPSTISSIPFYPYHFVRYHFVLEPIITVPLRISALQVPRLKSAVDLLGSRWSGGGELVYVLYSGRVLRTDKGSCWRSTDDTLASHRQHLPADQTTTLPAST